MEAQFAKELWVCKQQVYSHISSGFLFLVAVNCIFSQIIQLVRTSDSSDLLSAY